MLSTLTRAIWIVGALLVANASIALAETKATPAPKTTKIAQAAPAQDSATVPLPTPNPLTVSGFFRAYYFTRQNASNNPGAQFNFSSAKYSSTGVNQASFNSAIDLHAEYAFAGGGWSIGGSYFYGDPWSGACATALSHANGSPCVTNRPPNTNPDDTLPGFILNTFPEAYLAYKGHGLSAKIGDQLFTSPWAGPYDGTRIKPVAYQGADVAYNFNNAWTVEVADFLQFQNRTSSTFTSNTLLTSYPAGNPGLAKNIWFPGGGGKDTGGFFYGKLGYAPKDAPYAVDGYLYSVSDLVNAYWGDARYTFSQPSWKPFVALQGGWESNAGASYIGKIQSSVIGFQIGAVPYKGLTLTAGFDYTPWHVDTIAGNWCNNANNQVSVPKGTTLAYFLPTNTAQCLTNAAGTQTQIYYGGWASPYTDAYATDPLFTTQISQGMADRRAPGSAWKVAANYTTANKKWVFIASDAWYNYGNALAAENTNEWNLDGSYKFSSVKPGPYKGLLLRYRYAQRSLSNTFCGASATTCPGSLATGSAYLGGLALFKYNRAQLEYDF